MSSDGGNVTVVLTDDTKVQQPKGLGLRKKQMSVTILVPGLRITADGVGDAQNRLVAKSITFDKDDLEMAEAIQAGLTPTKAAVQSQRVGILRRTNKLLRRIPRPFNRTRKISQPTRLLLRPTGRPSRPTSSRSRTPPSVSPN